MRLVRLVDRDGGGGGGGEFRVSWAMSEVVFSVLQTI